MTRKILLMSLALILALPIGNSTIYAEPQHHNDFEHLLDAIAQVESSNNPNAIGDSGRAIGLYQIHRCYWQDGIRILGVDWNYNQAFDPQKSRQLVKAYLLHYGRGKSLIDLARIHNGGPEGHKKKINSKIRPQNQKNLTTQIRKKSLSW